MRENIFMKNSVQKDLKKKGVMENVSQLKVLIIIGNPKYKIIELLLYMRKTILLKV